MTSRNPHLAFDHPVRRAAALALPGDPPRDRIAMTDHRRQVEIGAFRAERGVTQTLRFDVVVEVATRAEQAADDVDRILSYDRIVEAIDASLAPERVDLLETLAVRIADRILGHPLALRCIVRIGKLDRGPYELGVEIVRDAPARPAPRRDSEVRPRVVYLSAETIARPDLPVLVDALAAGDAPLVLCVGRADLPVPQAGSPGPQRRIDLLAVAQMAWALAARDPRCVVVESLTELDWALRRRQVSVWAPSRLAPDPASDAREWPDDIAPSEPFALALWLARSLAASEVVAYGAPHGSVAPAGLPVTFRPAAA
jgi:dihydroneopterin aldolase